MSSAGHVEALSVRPIERVLNAGVSRPRFHPPVANPDGLGDHWDTAWDGIDEQVAAWPLAQVLAELPLRDDMAAVLDRHVVESDPSLVTADEVVRGALVRSLVEGYVNRWVRAHS